MIFEIAINCIISFYLLPLGFSLWYIAMQKIEDKHRLDGHKAFNDIATFRYLIKKSFLPFVNIVMVIFMVKVVIGWIIRDLKNLLPKQMFKNPLCKKRRDNI